MAQSLRRPHLRGGEHPRIPGAHLASPHRKAQRRGQARPHRSHRHRGLQLRYRCAPYRGRRLLQDQQGARVGAGRVVRRRRPVRGADRAVAQPPHAGASRLSPGLHVGLARTLPRSGEPDGAAGERSGVHAGLCRRAAARLPHRLADRLRLPAARRAQDLQLHHQQDQERHPRGGRAAQGLLLPPSTLRPPARLEASAAAAARAAEEHCRGVEGSGGECVVERQAARASEEGEGQPERTRRGGERRGGSQHFTSPCTHLEREERRARGGVKGRWTPVLHGLSTTLFPRRDLLCWMRRD